jgi:hypothetical protein
VANSKKAWNTLTNSKGYEFEDRIVLCGDMTRLPRRWKAGVNEMDGFVCALDTASGKLQIAFAKFHREGTYAQ